MNEKKLESLQQEVTTLKKNQQTMKSDFTAALSKLSNQLANKDSQINSLRASVEELKRNYAIEEAENSEEHNESTG